MKFNIGNKTVGLDEPTYIIAEIGANHDGNLDRAKKLIEMAKNSGADCAKFQYYKADSLVSRSGMEQIATSMGLAHYTENPYDVFKKYEVPWGWTPELSAHCKQVGIEFLATPYDIATVGHLDMYVNAFKIGSGDITYTDLINRVALTGKPAILSTGATSDNDLYELMNGLTDGLFAEAGACLMQCNTNYSGNYEDFKYANLSIIPQFIDGGSVAGYSDHSHSLAVILGAVSLGASIIEAHFTDGESSSPDNGPFAWNPKHFKAMVSEIRKLEAAFGDGNKKLEDNEKETVILQRRCIRAARELTRGTILTKADLVYLRPAPIDSLPPYRASSLVGKTLTNDLGPQDYLKEEHFV